MKAIYSQPVHRSLSVCSMCLDTFPDCNCVECMKPETSVVDILDFGVGINNDRANIEFQDGRVKNVLVDTLCLMREGATPNE